MDLSKAFNSIPYDLLIAKMHAYSFSKNSLVLFYSYLKIKKQNFRISNIQILLSDVAQGSILGSILFSIFINDFSFGYQVLNYSTLWMIAQSVRLKIRLKNALAP